MYSKTVDARGMACPLPVVNAKKAAEEMANGGILTVLVDNEIAVQNLTKFGASRGFQASAEKKGEKDFAVSFQIPEKMQKRPIPLFSQLHLMNQLVHQMPKSRDLWSFFQQIPWEMGVNN